MEEEWAKRSVLASKKKHVGRKNRSRFIFVCMHVGKSAPSFCKCYVPRGVTWFDIKAESVEANGTPVTVKLTFTTTKSQLALVSLSRVYSYLLSLSLSLSFLFLSFALPSLYIFARRQRRREKSNPRLLTAIT